MKLHVPDMTCNHCVASITKAVQSLSADAQVICNLQAHEVDIPNLVEVSPEKVVDALDDIGFEATVIEAEA
ncbi:MAG TPA: heavy-metal-associated domain-containing protein [Orrella sp.]